MNGRRSWAQQRVSDTCRKLSKVDAVRCYNVICAECPAASHWRVATALILMKKHGHPPAKCHQFFVDSDEVRVRDEILINQSGPVLYRKHGGMTDACVLEWTTTVVLQVWTSNSWLSPLNMWRQEFCVASCSSHIEWHTLCTRRLPWLNLAPSAAHLPQKCQWSWGQ